MAFLKRKGAAVFFLVLVIHCVLVYLDLPLLRGLSKGLLVPVLILYAWLQAGTRVSSLAYAGLVFAFVGDLLLLGKGDLFFLCGMLAFVGTHICNSLYFLRLADHTSSRLREAFLAAVVLMLASVTVFARLNEHLGSFRIPVLVYMLVISIMTILAAHTAGNPASRKIAWGSFIPGAGLFVISDIMLAMNKFLLHEPLLDIPAIASYGLAEYFLVKGFIAVSENNTSLATA